MSGRQKKTADIPGGPSVHEVVNTCQGPRTVGVKETACLGYAVNNLLSLKSHHVQQEYHMKFQQADEDMSGC